MSTDKDMDLSEERHLTRLMHAEHDRRRVGDAARILPVLGFLLFLVPLLWPVDGRVPISAAVLYIFSVWILLIGIVAGLGVLTRLVHRDGAGGGMDVN